METKEKTTKMLTILVLSLVLGMVGTVSGWSNRDVGTPLAPGSATYDASGGMWVVVGDGNDIWEHSDNFHYVYKYLKGDGQITARVVGIMGPGTQEWAKAGVMIRETVAADSKHATMVMTPGMGHAAAFQWRDTTGGGSVTFHGGSMTLPYWVRIERTSDTFAGYHAPDAAGSPGSWTQQGPTQTIPMGTNAYIGLAVTSHENGILRTVKFDNVTVVGEVGIAPAFTYQGHLMDTNVSADGLYDLKFRLYDVSNGGTQQGTTIATEDVDVIDGYFTVELDFGTDVFGGDARWLEVGVRPGASTGSFTTLSPRTELTPMPYALYAASTGGILVPLEVNGSVVGPPGAVIKVTNTGSGHAIVGSCSSSDVIGESHSAGVYGEATNTGQDEINYGGYFISKGGHGKGVFGGATGIAGRGVQGEATGINGRGVYGSATVTNGVGVYGVGSRAGIMGESTNGDGIKGESTAADKSGVYGYNDNGVGVKGRSANSTGVVGWTGTSDGSGVLGRSEKGIGVTGMSDGNAGVKAETSSTNSEHAALVARNTGSGPAIYAESTTNGIAAIFVGNVQVKSRSTGAVIAELGEGLDYAEGFNVSDRNEICPGTVLIIDPDNPGKLAVSGKPYDRKVAGIVTGAKGLGSGVRLGITKFDYDVALAGRVYCNVDATKAAVQPGDLLTTSATPGYAMKAGEYMRAQGAILGKAMEKLEKGKKGQILVLVTLQ